MKSTNRITSSSAVPGSAFTQRTFCGASVSKVGLSAGFGDSASTMSLTLIEDEFNKGDQKPQGQGQDPYHNGVRDNFAPPPVGSPVFFGLGPSYTGTGQLLGVVNGEEIRGPDKSVTLTDSFRKTLDDAYGTSTTSDGQVGYWDLAFGGILQTYNQTRSNTGNPIFTAQVVDPREILANVELILRNYAGTTFNNSNMFNLYGFLEYNGVPVDLKGWNEDLLTRTEYLGGQVDMVGTDMRYNATKPTYESSLTWSGAQAFGGLSQFPITGTGLSRVGPQGIPYYRVVQALNALGGLYGQIPPIYTTGGFGGNISFRGFNYALDLSGVPIIDQFYYLDYDKMNLLDFCQEICEITSRELFVSLFPIVDHPAFTSIYNYNQTAAPQDMIHGMIRVDTIDRKASQQPDAIRSYIENVMYGNITKSDVGVELSNVVTDKFITGGQEITNHFFSTSADRLINENNNLNFLSKMTEQQMIPYYGTLKSGAVTIPRGIGAFQQILLNSTNLNITGVGDYYVATEMELRAAAISFDAWRDFLMTYNNTYMESMEDNDRLEGQGLQTTPNENGIKGVVLSNNYAVTVPRCLFAHPDNEFGNNGLPKDVCHPPYGYPLYYKRATGIGLNVAGLAAIGQSYMHMSTSIGTIIGNSGDDKDFITSIRSVWQQIKDSDQDWTEDTTQAEKEFYSVMEQLIEDYANDALAVQKEDVIGLLQEFAQKLQGPHKIMGREAKKAAENAQQVYKFVKDVANKNLGKKFLVKLPNKVSTAWSEDITVFDREAAFAGGEDGVVETGPFGFKPRTLNNDPRIEASELDGIVSGYGGLKIMANMLKNNVRPTNDILGGAFINNFNPITNELITNYTPNNNGGYWDYELTNTIDQRTGQRNLIAQGLVPVDLTPITKGNGRISCYVRFDNSQNLSFAKINKAKFTQQVVEGRMQIPDANYQLGNVSDNKDLYLTPDDPEANGPKSIAFMVASVANKIYYAPKIAKIRGNVYGQKTKDIGRYSKPKRIYNCEEDEMQNSIPYLKSQFVPTDEPGADTTIQVLADGTGPTRANFYDDDVAYALITLPNKVEPTVDSRLRDGPMQIFNAQEIKHFMMHDVVRGVPGFDVPAFRGETTDIKSEFDLDPISLTARRAIDIARERETFAERRLAASSPSPVYPDMICLPLMSQERCYGPWSSSLMNDSYQNVGGDIEYSKDENLAPWNYSGYELMNRAGVVKAEYSNSTLLQSERGSFSIPAAPSGISLGSYLMNQGPLITSINVDIGAGGIQTSYVMDMYTSSFGKLQKQKSEAISKIGRTRQQQEDRNNEAIRRGLARSQVDDGLDSLTEEWKDFSIEQDGGVDLTPGYVDTTKGSITTTTMTVQEREEYENTYGPQDDLESPEQPDSVYRSYTYTGGMNDGSSAGDAGGIMPSDVAAKDYSNSADSSVGETSSLVSQTPRSDSMSSIKNKNRKMDELYDDDIEPDASWG